MTLTLDDVFTSVSLWGKDHWSTLLYLETRIVDHGGKIKDANMRGKNPQYPTRLNDGTVIEMHSDWDCLDDMIHAGMVTVDEDVYGLTDYGWTVVGALRKYRAINRATSGFEVPKKEEG
jgi:hypothetical protein